MVKSILRDQITVKPFRNKNKMKRVVIYGAGVAGAQLANSINLEASHIIKSFIDDSPKLWDREIYNITDIYF